MQLTDELRAIAHRLQQSTVQIRSDWAGAGSGVIWQPDGLILTNAHVVRGRGEVELADGRVFAATLQRRDSARDLAALRIDAAGLTAATVGDSTALQVGQLVLAVGNPLGMVGALTVGVVHAAPTAGSPWMRADVRLAPGNSGGPLADVQGRVVGINSMIADGLAIAISTATVQCFLQKTAPIGNPLRLGVTLQPVWVPRDRWRGQMGLLVLAVAPGAAVTGALRPGDILLSANEQPFRSAEDLLAVLDNTPPGSELRLEYLRSPNFPKPGNYQQQVYTLQVPPAQTASSEVA
ncbi:S1C family serine protease [Thermoleptolyngbya sp.]